MKHNHKIKYFMGMIATYVNKLTKKTPKIKITQFKGCSGLQAVV